MIVKKTSPNQNERKDVKRPSMLILHYTGTKTAEEADAIYMTPGCVSPHYMIDRDGSVIKYVDETMRAWHAGASSWDGITDINSASIGIEVVNGGHEFGLEEFPEIQIEKLIALIGDILSRWEISPHYILGHSDVAPGRKIDPGEKFPWRKLHAAGIGVMPERKGPLDIPLAPALKKYGYDYTDDLDVLKTEFARHYLCDTFGHTTDEEISYALASLLARKK